VKTTKEKSRIRICYQVTDRYPEYWFQVFDERVKKGQAYHEYEKKENIWLQQ
jgi:hypothetical protein